MVLLGSSGQNVTDLIQFTSLESGLDALEVIANSRYLAPTAPDTLACYPFTMKDPLIISDDEGGFAHVLFAGNQMSTDSKLIADGKVRLASVADFSVSQSVLLIDVNNMSNVRVIEFDMPIMM
jgi:DNA polymerase delta subunit 2